MLIDVAITSLCNRLRFAYPAAAVHLALSLLVAVIVGALVWWLWFPGVFARMAGGREILLLLVVVDVICGPLLTLVIFNRHKSRGELKRDLSVIALIQTSALVYGLHAVYMARPLFLVHEIDRFHLVAQPDFLGANVKSEFAGLSQDLRPSLFSGPRLVGVRPSKDSVEHIEVMMESLAGGRDFAQRPSFYVPYDADYRKKVVNRAKSLDMFVAVNPDSLKEIHSVLAQHGLATRDSFFVPFVHRQSWIAIVDRQGNIVGFVPGDGFSVQ